MKMMIKRSIMKYKYISSICVLFWILVFRKIKRLTRPFSDDPDVLKMLPLCIYRLCKRRLCQGPLFPEWPFLFELIQCVMKCCSEFHHTKLVNPPTNTVLFRANAEEFFAPIAWLSCFFHGLYRETVYVDNNVRCEWVKPKVSFSASKNDDTLPYVLFYLHGGGYIALSPTSHTKYVCRILESTKYHLNTELNGKDETQIHAFFVDYRKSPEHVFPAAVEDALTAYNYLTINRRIPTNRIIIAGDSAGGGLALSLLLWLRKQGRDLPTASICISPLVDLKGCDPDCQHDIISNRQAIAVKTVYLSDHEDMTTWGEASPIHNNLGNLPPLFIQAGDKEFLYPQCLRLAARAHADGTQTVLDVHKNMPHVFSFFDEIVLPQSREGIETIGKFAAHQFHNGSLVKEKDCTTVETDSMRRNVSSMQLGEKDCFVQPHYLRTDVNDSALRRVSSAQTFTGPVSA